MNIEAIGMPLRLADGTTVPLSSAIRAGNLLFVSGQLSLDDAGSLVGRDIDTQTHQVMARLRAVLQSAGADLDRVVKTSVWLTDKADFASFNAVYREYFPNRPPARSTVISELLVVGARIEIDVVAYIA
jgi:2-iminobutanoate/2-iminopropanoate deaminase